MRYSGVVVFSIGSGRYHAFSHLGLEELGDFIERCCADEGITLGVDTLTVPFELRYVKADGT